MQWDQEGSNPLLIQPFIQPPAHTLSSKLSLSFMAHHQNPVCISLLLHTCHMPHPAHPPSFFHLNNICWAVQIIKILIMPFSSNNQTSFSSPCSTTPAYVVPSMSRPSFIPIQNNRQNYNSLQFNLHNLMLWISEKICYRWEWEDAVQNYARWQDSQLNSQKLCSDQVIRNHKSVI